MAVTTAIRDLTDLLRRNTDTAKKNLCKSAGTLEFLLTSI